MSVISVISTQISIQWIGVLLPGRTCFTIVFTLASNGYDRAFFPHVVGIFSPLDKTSVRLRYHKKDNRKQNGREELIESAVSYVDMSGGGGEPFLDLRISLT